jgi:Zn-dependent protease
MNSPILQLRDNPQAFVAFVVAVIVAITVHEFSHAAVATLEGDRTPRSQGRLTLNPLAHLDVLGSIALLVAGFGWGKPVQFNPNWLRNRRVGAAMVGLAGPFSNFLLAVLSALAVRLYLSSGRSPVDAAGNLTFALVLLVELVSLNVVLGVFNLLPIPPLDGSRLLSMLLPPNRQQLVYFLDQYGIFILIAIVFLAPNLLSPFFRSIQSGIYHLVGLPTA